jgi:peptidoglycan/LPS O-acetylase OafA/YrhL
VVIAGEVIVAAPARERLRSLDGLRGVAAMVVVAHHLLLCFGWLSDPYADPPAHMSGVQWLMTYTPLHALWAGPEAVVVFFVLSGFVLTGTDLSTPRRTAGYAAKRFARLYVPVCAAVAVAGVERALFPRSANAASGWLAWHAGRIAPADHLRAAALVLGEAGRKLDSVLWSLSWEVQFSALLPLVVAIFLVATGRRAAAVIASMLAASVVISVYQSNGLMLYMPMFIAGALAATHAAAIAEWFRRRSPLVAGATAGVGAVLLSARWLINPPRLVHDHVIGQLLQGFDNVIELAGACLIVLGAANMSAHNGLLQRRLIRYVGQRSFSLYLVHEPVIVSVAQVFHPQERPGAFVEVSLLAIVAVTEVFYRLVERPSTRLAGRLYRRTTAERVLEPV